MLTNDEKQLQYLRFSYAAGLKKGVPQRGMPLFLYLKK